MLNHIKIIFLKEAKEVIRDKRSWMTILMVSIFLPASMMVGLMYSAQKREETKATEYQIEGAEHAPALISYLNEQGLITRTDLETDSVHLTIPEDFREKIGKGYIPSLIIRANYSKHNDSVKELQEALREYSQEIGLSRLIARGVSPIALKPFDVDVQDTGAVSMIAKILAPMLVFMFTMVPISALMPAAIDSTAGERERHGLFPILLQPISPISVILGKYLMLVVAGMVALSIATAVGFTGFSLIKIDGMNLGLDMSAVNGLLFVVILLPTVSLISAIIMSFATFAKTFKEGQTYAGLSVSLPMVFMGVGFVVDEAWRPHMPFWSEITAATTLLAGDNVAIMAWLGTVLIYAVIIGLSMYWMSRTIRRQAIESSG